MSVTGSSEIRRAAVGDSAPTGGATVDDERLQADEDREIVAVQISKAVTDGRIEVSFSTSGTFQQGGGGLGTNSSRAPVVAASWGEATLHAGGLSVDWAEGEELHVNTVNNSGAGINYNVIVYYREV